MVSDERTRVAITEDVDGVVVTFSAESINPHDAIMAVKHMMHVYEEMLDEQEARK